MRCRVGDGTPCTVPLVEHLPEEAVVAATKLLAAVIAKTAALEGIDVDADE